MNYPHTGDSIGDSVGLPIPWAIENLVICSNEVFETSIDSTSEKIFFECANKEMTKVLNLGYECQDHRMPMDCILDIWSWSPGRSLPLIFCIHVRSGPIYWGGYLPCKKYNKVMVFYMKKAWKYYMWWYFTCKHVSLF